MQFFAIVDKERRANTLFLIYLTVKLELFLNNKICKNY